LIYENLSGTKYILGMEAKREQIVALLHAGFSIPDIMSKVSVSRATIFNTKKRLKEFGHVKRRPGSCGKPTVTTPRLVANLKARIKRNPIRSMRGMAKELNVSEFTVRSIVKKKIGAKSLSRTKIFLLTDRLKALKLERSKKLLWILKKKMPIILFTDEKYFTVDQVQNSRTDRYITKLKIRDVPDHIRTIKKTKHPSQLMMFGLVASNGLKMPPVFLEQGFRMGAKEYLEVILNSHVLPWIQDNFPDPSEIVFMQDGAPCHTAKSVQKWLRENLNFWSKEMWPPSSPDLNPLDFSIWAYVQAKACKSQHPNLEAMRIAVSKVWNNMSSSYIKKTCSKFRPRIEAVIEAEGGYID